MKENDLTDYEKILLETYKKVKDRTQEEINEFINIIISLREQPLDNPQLKQKEAK